MAFRVIKIVNEYTVIVTPEWRIWKHNKGGDLVRISGYTIPKKSSIRYDAKKRLQNLLLNQEIELRNITGITEGGSLVSEVYVNGENVAALMASLSVTPKAKSAPKGPALEEKREPEIPETLGTGSAED
jgi:endonuclease YncB( thermonuclease family)